MREELLQLADTEERLTGVHKDQIVAIEGILISFGATAAQVKTMLPLVLDISAATGRSAVMVARSLGEAAQGNSNALLGLTIRDDAPSRVFMGSAIVRNHSVSGQEFQGDAWFGCRDVPEKSVSPVTDAAFIENFVNTLGLKRGNSRGISVVVPSVDERVDVDALRRGIARSFFWPILLGELVVDLESPGENRHIDAETLASHRTLLPPTEAAVVEFAAWASTAKPSETVTLQSEAATKSRFELTMPAKHKDWTREEHILAFNLYCKIPFGRQHRRATWGWGAGLVCVDTNYIYVSVGTDTWKRASLGAW